MVNELLELPIQMVVFSTDRSGGKAILKADTQGATPTRRARRSQFKAGNVIEDAKAVACPATPPLTKSSAAFHAQPSWPVKRPMPSVFTRVESVGLSKLTRELLRSAQSPCASNPNTNWLACRRYPICPPKRPPERSRQPSPVTRLPAGCYEIPEIPAIVAGAPAAVETDIETAPVVDGGDHRGRRLVGAGREIGGRSGSRQAQRD